MRSAPPPAACKLHGPWGPQPSTPPRLGTVLHQTNETGRGQRRCTQSATSAPEGPFGGSAPEAQLLSYSGVPFLQLSGHSIVQLRRSYTDVASSAGRPRTDCPLRLLLRVERAPQGSYVYIAGRGCRSAIAVPWLTLPGDVATSVLPCVPLVGHQIDLPGAIEL